MEEHKHLSMGGLDGPCVFEDLGGRVGLVENAQGPSRAYLNFLSGLGDINQGTQNLIRKLSIMSPEAREKGAYLRDKKFLFGYDG
jgi:hypothetical protein